MIPNFQTLFSRICLLSVHFASITVHLKQETVVKSTIEAEYIALSAVADKGIYLDALITELGFGDQIGLHVKICCGNQAVITFVKNADKFTKTKAVLVRYHLVVEMIDKKNIQLEYINLGTSRQTV